MRRVEKGRLVGRGGTAGVYEWERGRVLKLFAPEFAYSADMEYENTRAVHAAGVRTPQVFERLQVEGREGIVFERVEGPTLLEAPRAERGDLAARLAEIHAGIHAHESADLPTRADRGRQAADRLGDVREAVAEREARVPDGRAVCHALFHPGHVLLSAAGPVIIDWPDAFSGPAALDVARTAVYLRYLGVSSTEEAPRRERLADAYLRAYLERTDVTAAEVERCKPLVAFVLLRYAPDHPERAALERLSSLGPS